MKVFFLSLLVAAAFAAPAPLDEETGEPVELIVNGVAEGEPLEIGDVLGIKVKQHVDGVIVATNDLLHPLTAAGLEELEVAERPEDQDIVEIENPEIPVLPPIIPEPIEIPDPILPELSPAPVVLPQPVLPELSPAPVVLPQPILPELSPEPVVIPDPVLPELIPDPVEIPDPILPEILPPVLPEIQPPVDNLPELEYPVQPDVPEPDQFPNGEIFNNGVVQVHLNAEPGLISTVQSWFSMVFNYFNGSEVSSQQIV